MEASYGYGILASPRKSHPISKLETLSVGKRAWQQNALSSNTVVSHGFKDSYDETFPVNPFLHRRAVFIWTLFASQYEQMRIAVERLVHAAQERIMRWPWEGPLTEVAKAAAYGKAIAPLLLERLADAPDSLENDMPEADWNVQQQIALALCRIYAVNEDPGHVYMNRATRGKMRA